MARRKDMEQQIESLEQRIQELEKQLENYRAKEYAIVHALTDAQATSRDKVSEAQARAASTLEQAENEARERLETARASAERMEQEAASQKESALSEAEREAKSMKTEAEEIARQLKDEAQVIKCDAEREAARLEAQAHMQAEKRIEEAEEKARELANAAQTDLKKYDEEVEFLRRLLSFSTEKARLQAEQFKQALSGIALEADALLTKGRGLEALIEPHKGVLPEEYHTPSELIYGLYKLEGRALPEAAEEALAEEALNAASQEADKPLESEKASGLLVEDDVWDMEKASDALAPTPLETPVDHSADEERVWTVDEIIAQQDNATLLAQEVDLDELLDEIMGI